MITRPFSLCSPARLAVRCALFALLAVLPSLIATPLQAQFSGPGPTVAVPTTATVTTDRSLLFPETHDPELQPGDLLTIRIFGQPEFATGVRLSSDGSVLLPLIGTVKLGGLTISQAEIYIEHRLIDAGMFRKPQVTITLTEGQNQVVAVVGEVHASVPVVGSRRLLDVLAVAGGLPATASHVITISRPGVAQPIVVDLGTDPLRSNMANIPIFPGDTIIVSRIGVVYMVGDFRTPGTIPLTQYTPLTLMEATALSGGLLYQGKYNDVRLIRTVGDHRTVVKLDVQRILHGKDPDPVLEANDIVFMPDDNLKAFIQNGSLNTLFGVVALIITLRGL